MDDSEKILVKIRIMEGYVTSLKKYSRVSLDKLSGDGLLRDALDRRLQLALEASLDVGEIVISSFGFRKPESYWDVIKVLGEEGVLPKDFARKFENAAGFRNILVHFYAEVDVTKLHSFIRNNLSDFDEYAMYVTRYLKKKKKP